MPDSLNAQLSREQQIAALEKDWAQNPRWKSVKRGYTAADVVRLRGSLQPEYTLAKRGAEKLWDKINGGAKKGYVNAFGAITAGRNLYHHEKRREAIGAGDVVLMNPGEVHACQPLEAGQTWAYHMLYVDAGWLAALWQDNDRQTGRRWQPLPAILCRHPALHAGLVRLGATLFDPLSAPLAQHSAAIGFFEGLQRFFRPETGRSHLRAPDRLDRAARIPP